MRLLLCLPALHALCLRACPCVPALCLASSACLLASLPICLSACSCCVPACPSACLPTYLWLPVCLDVFCLFACTCLSLYTLPFSFHGFFCLFLPLFPLSLALFSSVLIFLPRARRACVSSFEQSDSSSTRTCINMCTLHVPPRKARGCDHALLVSTKGSFLSAGMPLHLSPPQSVSDPVGPQGGSGSGIGTPRIKAVLIKHY